MTGRVLGADACKAGWVGVVLDGTTVDAHFGATIAELVGAADAGGEVAVVGIDIPIGLPDQGRRRADVQARVMAGPRWASVFMTPVRAALAAGDHAEAVRLNRERTGEGVSQQAYGLRHKILDVDAWIRDTGRRAVEVHPELSFAQLADGAALAAGKTTWAGAQRRRELLAAAGVLPSGDLGQAGRLARVDDVLAAAAAAWSARRVLAGAAFSIPAVPEQLAGGVEAAIWV
ncbi:DUF429 domain-containing protein [Catellatospora paridis]|uniref:DUF429 domain-containing protein n=1 Tax=Catellatospora paridis TaxID=1617086 RepID=UPI0012D422AA|nr:DUF429 domain-containing protein [Catellatospora paridis]